MNLFQLPENNRENIKNLLLRIFPKLEAVFNNNNYGYDWVSIWRKESNMVILFY